MLAARSPRTEPSKHQATGWRERSTQPRVRALEVARERSLERATKFVHAAIALLSPTLGTDFSVRQVIGRAGLSRRAFYEIFESKDDLLVAVYEETIRLMVQEIESSLSDIDEPVERLHRIVNELFLRSSSGERVRQSALMSTEYKRLVMLRPTEMRGAIEPAIFLLQRELEEAMDVGVVRRAEPAILARILLSVGLAQINTALLETLDGWSSGVTANALWDFCRHALGIRQ